MEFRYRAGERPRSFLTPSGGGGGNSATGPSRAGLQGAAELTREEMIAREVSSARREMIAQEARRELDLERLMVAHRLRDSLFYHNRLAPYFGLREWLGPVQGFAPPELGLVGTLHPKSLLAEMPRCSEPVVDTFVPCNDNDGISSSEERTTRSGVKRKAERPAREDELQQMPDNKWNCALCKVSTTGEQTLKEHMQGKKHKKKEESLRTGKLTTQYSGGSLFMEVDNAEKAVKPLPVKTVTPIDGLANSERQGPFSCDICQVVCTGQDSLNLHLGGKKHNSLLKEKETFMCAICKVSCNCQELMDSHLCGKKHKSKLKEKEGKGKGRITEPFWCDSEVKCDNQAMLDSHLGGKKQMTKLKESEGEVVLADSPKDIPMELKEAQSDEKITYHRESSTKQEPIDHMQGKKLKAKEESLGTDKPSPKELNSSTSMEVDNAKEVIKTKEVNKPLTEKTAPITENAMTINGHGKNKLEGKGQFFWCDVCKVNCHSKAALDWHLNGKMHKSRVEKSKQYKPVMVDDPNDKPVEEKTSAMHESEKNSNPVASMGPRSDDMLAMPEDEKDKQPA